MAFPWMVALKVIPWGDVIEHAPKVLKGAKQLLDRQKQPGPVVAAPLEDAPAPGSGARLQALEATQRQLQQDLAQLVQTTAELAEQNSRLVQAVEVLRWRTRWLAAVSVGLALGGVALLFWPV
jgi:alkylhydroperoxidase/carboxymuconolactone decarboxylase family protein YurZ